MPNRVALFVLTLLLAIAVNSHARAADAPQDGLPFDDSPYAVRLPNDATTTNAFSVSAWVNPAVADESLGIMSVGAPARFFTFYTFRNATRMLVESSKVPGGYAYALAPQPRPNVWTHYAGTYDGETIKIYMNGALVASKSAPASMAPDAFNGKTLILGAVDGADRRPFRGKLNDLALWNRTLTSEEVERLVGADAKSLPDGLVAVWNRDSLASDGDDLTSAASPSLVAKRLLDDRLLNRRDDGYRGIWYYNQKLNNEYVYKYSGGLGTYCANHYPFSVFRPEVNKTFFCYGGADPSEETLWHEVGVYDGETGLVSRPTVLLDKQTNDAHDNPVISVDDQGYVWVFSTSHGTSRPSFVHRSLRPYDVSEFERVKPTKIVDGAQVPMTNFSYLQIWNVPKRGFVAFFTTYDRKLVAKSDPNSKAQRILAFMTSEDGIHWSEWKPLAAIEIGHYQNAKVRYDLTNCDQDGKPRVILGTAFNYHPGTPRGNRGVGLNWRTNIYYMESDDFGKTWRAVDSKPLELPILKSDSDALVRNYEEENLNVYITDLEYDSEGRPMIAYVTSKGFESGPESGPRDFCFARWDGKEWLFSKVCQVDNNYEFSNIYPEEVGNGVVRLVGSFEDGPQGYNTGGEISQWISRDFGRTWSKEYQLTEGSLYNQCFPRRTVDASPDFYAFWADGSGREKSISNLRFSTKDGKVFELPRKMTKDWEAPSIVRDANIDCVDQRAEKE